MTFKGNAAETVFPELFWILWINGWYVKSGQYSHMEPGDYPFHFVWGMPAETGQRGRYRCWEFWTCHLGPSDSVEVLFGGWAISYVNLDWYYYLGLAVWW